MRVSWLIMLIMTQMWYVTSVASVTSVGHCDEMIVVL